MNDPTSLPLWQVTEQAGIGQVIRLRRPAMFLADDVINLTTKECIVS